MTFLTNYAAGGAVILVLVTLLWLFSLRLHDASIIDSFWGAGFVILFWIYFFLAPPGDLPRRLLAGLLVTVWGLRLSIHIFLRNRGKGEDFRYARWRAEEGPRWAWLSYPRVFLLQGGLMWLISLPLLTVQLRGDAGEFTGLLQGVGVAAWAIGFFFEAAGDAQLARFKADPAKRGTVLQSGVWRYTRHPNYFGDAAQWWGFYLLAAAAGGWWSILSPLLMTWLLVRVSGVALLERTLHSTRPGYADYCRSTSAFIPWIPRKK